MFNCRLWLQVLITIAAFHFFAYAILGGHQRADVFAVLLQSILMILMFSFCKLIRSHMTVVVWYRLAVGLVGFMASFFLFAIWDFFRWYDVRNVELVSSIQYGAFIAFVTMSFLYLPVIEYLYDSSP